MQGMNYFNEVDWNAWEWFYIFGKAVPQQDPQAVEEEVPRNPQEPEVRKQDRLNWVCVNPRKEENVLWPGSDGPASAFTVSAAAPRGGGNNEATEHKWYVSNKLAYMRFRHLKFVQIRQTFIF